MKAIIYTRVSSDEQVKGTSLDYQEEICRKYCADKGFEVLEVFREEGASAKSANRAEFLRAIEYCRKNKGKVEAFVVAKVDRFARNAEDHYMVKKILTDFKVTLHSVTEPISDNAVGKVFEGMLALFSEFDNSVRKQRCTDGMYARIKQGIYPWQTPFGYKCKYFKKQGLKKTEPDDPHPVFFSLLQQALRELSSGVYNKASFGRRLDELGLAEKRGKKTTSQFIDTLLEERRLKFYAGWLPDPREGGWTRGQHKPMIEDTEVYKILEHLSGRRRTEAHNRHNPLFPLRGWALCGECGRKLTGSTSINEQGVGFHYYHCYYRNCSLRGKTIRKADIESDFTKYLEKVTPKEEWLKMLKETTIDYWEEKGETLKQDVSVYERKLATLEEKRRRIFDAREDGSYTKEEFQQRKEEVENDILATKISLSETKIDQFDIEEAVTYATNFIKDLARQWTDLPHTLQPKFQNLVIPEGFRYDRKTGVGTPKLGYIYELNQATSARNTTVVDPARIELAPVQCECTVLPLN